MDQYYDPKHGRNCINQHPLIVFIFLLTIGQDELLNWIVEKPYFVQTQIFKLCELRVHPTKYLGKRCHYVEYESRFYVDVSFCSDTYTWFLLQKQNSAHVKRP